jgi:DNA-binding transcriptional regulator YdaS (Cro superfamily)
VLKWQRVPPVRVLAVEELIDISREVLRADIYPPSSQRRARQAR